jgi:ketosteroid isomerase-like protein
MSPKDVALTAYERWNAGDTAGFLAMLPDNAVFCVPGSTRISGDHDKAGFRRVLDNVTALTAQGRHRQEMICAYESESGVVVLFDTYVGDEEKYHSMHEWIFRDGALIAWMLYVHEFDRFARVWA